MTHLAIEPVLAADAWQTIIGLLIFIFWSVLQWLGNRNEAKQQQKPRRPRPAQPVDPLEGRPAGGPAGPVPPPRDQADALRSEVEEFLRRAQGQPAREQPLRPAQQPPPPVRQLPQRQDQRRPVVSQAERPQPPRPLTRAQQPPRSQQPATSRQPIGPPQGARQGENLRQEGVGEHVARHLSTRAIVEHTSALGETVGLTDERLESRLHAKFDHEVGRLKHRETTSDDEPRVGDRAIVDLASEVVAMLSEPAGMRKLIIANEILRRPEW